MKLARTVGLNAAAVAMFSTLAARGDVSLIAIVAVALVIVGGVGWVISDARRTERLARIIEACRGRGPAGRSVPEAESLPVGEDARHPDAVSDRGGRTRERSRRGTRS